MCQRLKVNDSYRGLSIRDRRLEVRGLGVEGQTLNVAGLRWEVEDCRLKDGGQC